MYKCLSPGAIGVRADLARGAELAGKYGFDGVDVNIDEVKTLGVARAKEILAKAGARSGAFGIGIDYRKPEAEFVAGLAALPERCALAREMGITRAATWIPSWHDELDYRANYAFHVDRIGRIARALKPFGISFGLEFLGPKTLRTGKKFEFIHTLDGMLGLCRKIGTGNLGLLFDAFHWYTAGGTLADFDKLTDADVIVVHVNDAAKGVPPDEQIDGIRALPAETGQLDIAGFMKGLVRIGYSGPVVVEPFSARLRAMPPDEAVAETAKSLQTIWKMAGL